MSYILLKQEVAIKAISGKNETIISARPIVYYLITWVFALCVLSIRQYNALYIILSRGLESVLLLDNAKAILSCPSNNFVGLLVHFRLNNSEAHRCLISIKRMPKCNENIQIRLLMPAQLTQ